MTSPDRPTGDELEAFPSEGQAIESVTADASADFQWPVPADAFEQCEIVPLEGCAETYDQLRAPLRSQAQALVPYGGPTHGALQRVDCPGVPLSLRKEKRLSARQGRKYEPEPRRARLTVIAVTCFAIVSLIDLRMAQLENAAAPGAVGVVAPPQSASAPAAAVPADAPVLTLASEAVALRPAAPHSSNRLSRLAKEPRETSLASARKPAPRAVARTLDVRAERVDREAPARPRPAVVASAGVPASVTRPAQPPTPEPVAVRPTGPATKVAAAVREPAPAPEVARFESAPAVRTPIADRRPPAEPEPMPADAAIRNALARFRTAYSALDAKAAQAVWPSVNERALARAFEGLKSQEIAFDRCETVVKGAEASAACRGRSTYVPRVGPQAPRTNEHEWNFHLKKVNDRWTIDSASFR